MTATHSTRTGSPAPLVTIPGDAPPLLSVILVTYGTGRIVLDALASIDAAIGDAAFGWEAIVVDNPHPSGDGSTRRALQLDTCGVHVLRPDRNLGFGGGCELGALHADGDVLAFVNPDVELVPGSLPPLLAALDEPGVSIAAPVLLEPDGTVQEAGVTITPLGWTEPRTTVDDSDTTGVIDVEYASAACWVMRRDEHERLGGFDAAFHPAYFEDVDLSLRARRLGGRCVVVPSARAVHHRGTSTPDASVSDAQHEVFVERWPLVAWRAGSPQR